MKVSFLLTLFIINTHFVFSNITHDSIVIQVVSEQNMPIIGASVIQYPECYLLGSTNENGQVTIKGIHIPESKKIVFQCLGFQPHALLFKDIKNHPVVVLKEKIIELSEATIKIQSLSQIISTLDKQLHKHYKAKKEYMRYYGEGTYAKTVESKGKTIHLRQEHGLFVTTGNNDRSDKFDFFYRAEFIPAYVARSYDLTSDGKDTLKRLALLRSAKMGMEYDATQKKIFNVMRSVYLYAPFFSNPKNFDFKITDIDSTGYTILFSLKPEAYPKKNRALSRGIVQIDRQTLRLKNIMLDYLDYHLYELIHYGSKKAPFLTKATVTFEYDQEGHAYISQCNCETIWKFIPSYEEKMYTIERPSRPFAARNQLIEKEMWTCTNYKPIPEQYRTEATFIQALWASRYSWATYNKDFFYQHPNPYATSKAIKDLSQYKDLETQYQENSNKFYVNPEYIPNKNQFDKILLAKKILFDLFFNSNK